MKRIRLSNIFFAVVLVTGVYSCTDLEIEETDSFISEGFQGLEDPPSALTALYNNIGGALGNQENWYALNTVTTDEQLIPTRGADWDDNGLWRKLHQHNWGLEDRDVLGPFDIFSSNQLLASQILDERSAATADVAAQAHFLRAYCMYNVLDFYGQVPFRDTQLSSSSIPEVLSGAAAVDFILADLDAAIAGLDAEPAGTGNQNVASKAAARYLKAKVLLNRHIFENQLAAEPTPLSPDVADLNEVVNLVDAINADGYDLQEGYFELFQDSPDKETIWFVTAANNGNRIFNALHYNSLAPDGSNGGWNGFSTLAEFYDLFEGDQDANNYVSDVYSAPANNQEERRGGVPVVGAPFTGQPGTSDDGGFERNSNIGNGFLLGQQYYVDGTEAPSRLAGVPLVFERDFVNNNGELSLSGNSELTGMRLMKYSPRFNGGFTGHYILFRYADAHLMKAEAIFRGANGDADATALVNELRTIRGATPIGSVSESDLLDERGRELYLEGWRRNDMIRFGEYTRQWLFKSPDAVDNPVRNLFPIPLPQLLANPNLQQNPGYQ